MTARSAFQHSRHVDGLRDVRDDDAAALCALIAGVFAEYPGCVLETDGQDADLLAPAASIRAAGGEQWVVEERGALVACCGWVPHGAQAMELKRLYVGAPARRRGLGDRLAERVEAAARQRGVPVVELWSDTRFTDAHRLYLRRGYQLVPGTRALHDRSGSVEFHFSKQL